MAHALFGTRYAGRQAAWHGLGTVFGDTAPSVSEAFILCGLDYDVQLYPAFAEIPDVGFVPCEGRMVMRGPTKEDPGWAHFAHVSDDYEVIDNMRIAAALDPISGEWPVETCGALGSGERVFVSLYAGASSINGDEIQDYFLVSDGKDGANALRIMYTPVRVVCQNTLTAALSISGGISLGHSRGVGNEMELHIRIMAEARKSRDKMREQFERLAAFKLAKDDVTATLKAAHPTPKPSAKVRVLAELGDGVNSISADLADSLVRAQERHASVVEKAQERRAQVYGLYQKFNDEFPANAETGYALYNAVAEYADHREGRGSDRDISESRVFGERATEKARAFGGLVKLAG